MICPAHRRDALVHAQTHPQMHTHSPVHCGRHRRGLQLGDCTLHSLAADFAEDLGLLPLPLEEPKSLSPSAAASRGRGREATPAGEAGPRARTHWVTESRPSTSPGPHVPLWQNYIGPQLHEPLSRSDDLWFEVLICFLTQKRSQTSRNGDINMAPYWLDSPSTMSPR